MAFGGNHDGKSQLPYLRGELETHRDWIYGYTGTAQVVRTQDYLMEASDQVLGNPDGRLYYTGNSRFGKGYKRVDKDPEHAAGRAEMENILKKIPALTPDNPHWKTKKGKKWLEEYQADTDKFHHNHADYRFYDED